MTTRLYPVSDRLRYWSAEWERRLAHTPWTADVAERHLLKALQDMGAEPDHEAEAVLSTLGGIGQ